jgi:hypothetical protein
MDRGLIAGRKKIHLKLKHVVDGLELVLVPRRELLERLVLVRVVGERAPARREGRRRAGGGGPVGRRPRGRGEARLRAAQGQPPRRRGEPAQQAGGDGHCCGVGGGAGRAIEVCGGAIEVRNAGVGGRFAGFASSFAESIGESWPLARHSRATGPATPPKRTVTANGKSFLELGFGLHSHIKILLSTFRLGKSHPLQSSRSKFYPWIFFFRMSFRVTASAANLEIPSRSFSTAICWSLKSKRNVASSLMYVFFAMSSAWASAASSFLGTAADELYRSSRSAGLTCQTPVSTHRKLTEMVR